ncbi:response regulator [Halorhabdus salina]|uniref:response regulator n=1 Tax=Halorhabdus salina TaxID=2750670 RepID=UPI0015EECA77|nr:response regulator [Halorhabdus salina]
MTQTDSADADIHALLIDDNEQWASLVGSRIEDENDAISVAVATDANEAIVHLEDSDRVDCLVVDYMMPGITGLELLDRIREEHPDLPFILVTSEGSEDVAARAIEAGVSDYVVKEPMADQTVLLAEKISGVVTEHRLRQRLEASERRYRTVVEQSRDAICILREGRVQFCNRRFGELTGRDAGAWTDEEFFEEAVHPDEREQVRSALSNWNGDAQPAIQELRIRRADGTVRECTVTGRRISYEGQRGLLISIRDVSERQRRERELRWERDLTRTVLQALVESRTRDGFERAVVDELYAYGYPVAWIADGESTPPSPRTIAGDRAFVDALSHADRDELKGEPVAWAARSGGPQFVQDVTSLLDAPWQDAAMTHGYRAGGALPLEHNGVPYGLLAVYHETPERFDDTERRLLGDLADVIAFGSHTLETTNTLAAEQTVTARIRVSDDAYYLAALASEGAFQDSEQVRVQGTVPDDGDRFVQFLVIDGPSAILDALTEHPAVESVEEIDDDPLRLQVTATGPSPEAHLRRQGVIVESTTVEDDAVIVEVQLQSHDAVSSTVVALERDFDAVSVQAVTEHDWPAGDTASGFDALTDKQSQALRAAYHYGYFEQPRGSTASEIAESLGIAHSTFLQHLHRAQQQVFDDHFE